MHYFRRAEKLSRRTKRQVKKWLSKKKNQRKLAYVLSGVIILSLLSGLVIAQDKARAERQELESRIETKLEQLETVQSEREHLEKENSTKDKKLKKQEQEYKQEIESLKKQVKARQERERRLALSRQAEAQKTQQTASHAVSGSCTDWMRQAGIPITHASNKLILVESGCNPMAVNPTSGACGIPQSLPCSKMGPVNPNGTSAVSPVDQLRWMDNYVKQRYGGWSGALAHWEARVPINGVDVGHWY